MSSKAIIYDNFLKCQDFTLDTYWRDIIYNCACNRFPKGVKYDNAKNTIYVRYDISGRPKTESFTVPEDPKECFDMFTKVFRDILGLRSEYDVALSQREMEEFRKQNEIDLDCDWKKLKPRSMRNQILMNFAVSETRSRNMPSTSAKSLYHTILLGFQFKKLSSDDVRYSNGSINSIDGLEYSEKTQTFVLTKQQKNLSRTDKPTAKSNPLQQAIDKWIRGYKTNYILNL